MIEPAAVFPVIDTLKAAHTNDFSDITSKTGSQSGYQGEVCFNFPHSLRAMKPQHRQRRRAREQ